MGFFWFFLFHSFIHSFFILIFYLKKKLKNYIIILFIYYFIYLFTYLFIYTFIYLFIYLFIILFTYLFIYLFILFIYLLIYLFIYLFTNIICICFRSAWPIGSERRARACGFRSPHRLPACTPQSISWHSKVPTWPDPDVGGILTAVHRGKREITSPGSRWEKHYYKIYKHDLS